MTFNVHLVLLVAFVTLLLTLTLACDIEAVRPSADGGTVGGWSGVAVDDDRVVQLKQSVANDAEVVKAHHVIESYQQVVGHVTSLVNNAPIYRGSVTVLYPKLSVKYEYCTEILQNACLQIWQRDLFYSGW